MSQKQIAVALPDGLRLRVEEAALAGEQSIAAEIRLRLERTFKQEDDARARPDIAGFLSKVASAVELVEQITERPWTDRPAAKLLRHTINTALAHYTGPEDEGSSEDEEPAD
jgi:hypothetical protein